MYFPNEVHGPLDRVNQKKLPTSLKNKGIPVLMHNVHKAQSFSNFLWPILDIYFIPYNQKAQNDQRPFRPFPGNYRFLGAWYEVQTFHNLIKVGTQCTWVFFNGSVG